MKVLINWVLYTYIQLPAEQSRRQQQKLVIYRNHWHVILVITSNCNLLKNKLCYTFIVRHLSIFDIVSKVLCCSNQNGSKKLFTIPSGKAKIKQSHKITSTINNLQSMAAHRYILSNEVWRYSTTLVKRSNFSSLCSVVVLGGLLASSATHNVPLQRPEF